MKAKFLSVVSCVLCLNADIIISFDQLPASSKEFLSKYFKAEVGLVQKDKNSYEVYLSDGSELEFEIDGSWHEVENKANPFELDFLPPNLSAIIKNEFPNTKAIEIEKKISYYKIKLTNGVKIYMDFNGTILKKKIDD